MDIRSMECFVVVAEELHFRRAAERLNLTQPSVSQRIRVLENEIGAELFVRDRRTVALTPAGAAFLAPARSAVESARRAMELARRARSGEAGHLRLGFTVIAFYGVLPQAVQAFRERYHDVEVELFEMNSPSLETALLARTIDVAVLHPPVEHPQLSVRALPDEPLVLALPASHPLAALDIVPIAKLEGQPFLIAPRRIGPGIFDRVIALFQAHGVTPRVVQEVTPMTTLAGLVAAGVGMGLVTAGIARIERPGVAFRPIRPTAPTLPVAAAWAGENLPPIGRNFLDIVLELSRKPSSAKRR